MKGEMYKSYSVTESKVSKGMSSWQAHLQRIGPFLKPGIGIWWRSTNDKYEFLDSNNEPNFKQQGPSLQHYRETKLETIYKTKKVVWESILEQEIILPTPYIKLYNSHGEYLGRRYFEGSQADTATLEESRSNSPHHPTSTEEQMEISPQQPAEEEMDISPQQTLCTQECGEEMTSPT